MAIDYYKELERLKNYVPEENREYWSPEAGQYKVQALGEIEEANPFEDDEEQRPRAKLKIKVGEKEFTWGFAVGKTQVSTYGQIVNLAIVNGGTLKDKIFTVVVTGQDRNRRFTIVLG